MESDLADANIFSLTDVDELPSYTVASARTTNVYLTEHTWTLDTPKRLPWLTLKFRSRATSPQALPIFTDGDVISGTVTLNLSKPEVWKSAKIAIAGFATKDYQPSICFLEVPCTFWPSSSETQVPTQISWPFSLRIPRDCAFSANPKEVAKLYRLPPTFRNLAARIEYSLTVVVKKGPLSKFELGSSFVYVPRITAPPPSTLRLLTNAERLPLVGPKGDPAGWKVLPSVTVSGTIFNDRQAELQCTLAVASPLIFVLGYPLPLYMSLKCADPQAMQLLSSPAAITVKLVRLGTYGPDSLKDIPPVRAAQFTPRGVSAATFWHDTSEAPDLDDDGAINLHGEIIIPPKLQPSFTFPKCSFNYFVELYPMSAAGFSPSTAPDQPLLYEKVTLVTQNAPGFVPRSQAPPEYRRQSPGIS